MSTAATERWISGVDNRWHGDFGTFIRDQSQRSPDYQEIADTGAADSLNTVRHGLGRIPRRVTVVNSAVPAPGGAPGWYRFDTDAEWTATEITLRFDAANARVLLEIA